MILEHKMTTCKMRNWGAFNKLLFTKVELVEDKNGNEETIRIMRFCYYVIICFVNDNN